MPTYDYICETCGTEGRAWRTEDQGPPRFCSRKCRYRSKNPMRRGKPNKWVITPDMHDEILAVYQGDTGSGQIRDLAIRLGLPRWKVTRHAVDQGWIARQKKEPDWRERELAILKRCAHLTPQVIKKRLKKHGYDRSETGIVLKRRRMKYLQNLDGHSATFVGQRFGVDIHSVVRYIENGWLKAQRRGTNRTEAQGGDAWYIKDKDIREFIIANVAVIDFRKVDKHWLVDILARKRMKKSKTVSLRKQREKRREARAFASLHCVHYSKCRDKAAYANRGMECHKCDKLEFSRDNYQKEVGLGTISNPPPGEHRVNIESEYRGGVGW